MLSVNVCLTGTFLNRWQEVSYRKPIDTRRSRVRRLPNSVGGVLVFAAAFVLIGAVESSAVEPLPISLVLVAETEPVFLLESILIGVETEQVDVEVFILDCLDSSFRKDRKVFVHFLGFPRTQDANAAGIGNFRYRHFIRQVSQQHRLQNPTQSIGWGAPGVGERDTEAFLGFARRQDLISLFYRKPRALNRLKRLARKREAILGDTQRLGREPVALLHDSQLAIDEETAKETTQGQDSGEGRRPFGKVVHRRSVVGGLLILLVGAVGVGAFCFFGWRARYILSALSILLAAGLILLVVHCLLLQLWGSEAAYNPFQDRSNWSEVVLSND